MKSRGDNEYKYGSKVKVLALNKDFNAAVNEANGCLRRGGVVVYPTDTAYGLGVDAKNPQSVEKLYRLKERVETKPTHVIVSGWKMIEELCEVNDLAKRLFDQFLPGPLTMVLKDRGVVDRRLGAGSGTLGVRMPNSKFTQCLLGIFNGPITTPSANRSGGKTPYSITEVGRELNLEGVDLVIDGGELPEVKPSTIVDISRG